MEETNQSMLSYTIWGAIATFHRLLMGIYTKCNPELEKYHKITNFEV